MDLLRILIILTAILFQIIGVAFFLSEAKKMIFKSRGWIFFILGLILEVIFFYV